MAKRTRWLAGIVLAAGCLSFFVWGWLVYFRAPKLNVLIVTLDTTRADRIGCYRYPQALTPAMDELAANGVLFERAYASAPLTLPSHATIMSGLYPPEHGLHANGQNSLATEVPVLAEILAQQGYDTGAFIASFVLNAKFGLNRGFQTYDDQLSVDSHDGDQLHQNRPGDEVVGSALSWLKQHDSRPFLCWVHLYDPHFPHVAHENLFGERYRDRPYDGEITFVDLQLRRLLDHLQSRSLNERTIVIVVGDHGEGLGDHGERTHSNMLYNSTTHVPLIVKLPKSQVKGHRVPEPVSLVDLFPSLLDCLRLPVPQPVSGRSLKPALDGQAIDPRDCYSETDEPYHAARCSPLQSITTTRWKYIRTTHRELFDLQSDPAELKNLALEQPGQLQTMDELLSKMEQAMIRRDSPQAKLSTAEERALTGLGYTGGHVAPVVKPGETLPDTKDMLPYFNQCDDALKLMHDKKYLQAVVLLKPIVEAAPNYFEARCSLGVCLFQQKHYDAAAAAFEKALELGASPGTVNTQLGLARMMQKRYEDARQNFTTALETRAESAEVHYYLGMALRDLQRFDEALVEIERAIELNPNFEPARKAAEGLYRRVPAQ